MQEFTEIKITREEIKKCIEEATGINQAITQTRLKSYFNTEPLINRTIGQIGQLAFKKYLQQQQIPFEEDQAIGRSDQYDFKINDKLFDIKTNVRKKSIQHIKGNFKLLLLKKQLGKHADYYIWILLNQEDIYHINKAYIVGFLNKEQLQKYATVQKIEGIDALWIPPEDTIPIQELKNVI